MKAVLLSGATIVALLPIAKGTKANGDVRPRNRAIDCSRHRRSTTPVAATATATPASGDSPSSAPAAAPPPPPPPPPSLSSARGAARFTAAYIVLAGFAAIAAPLSVGAALFGKSVVLAGSGSIFVSSSSWIVRVLGVLAVTFGVYYAGASSGRGERGFYESTVIGRAALAASFVLLALFGLGNGDGSGSIKASAAAAVAAAAAAAAQTQKTPRFGLLILAAANAVGAASMALALRRDDRKKRREEEEEVRRKRALKEEERDW